MTNHVDAKRTPVPFTLRIYRRLESLPPGNFGKWLFTRAVCFKAPYFSSIRPLFTALQPGFAEVRIRKRRSVSNHIGTVHAIAMANMCELAAGTMCEVSVPVSMRWIPAGMQIQYLKKAVTDLRAVCRLPEDPAWAAPMDLRVTVDVIDESGDRVVTAVITMRVTARPVAAAPQ